MFNRFAASSVAEASLVSFPLLGAETDPDK